MRQPPDSYSDIDPSALTDGELLEVHTQLAEWIEEALSQPPAAAPDDDLYDDVYDKLSEISAERAMRQGEDRGASGRSGPF